MDNIIFSLIPLAVLNFHAWLIAIEFNLKDEKFKNNLLLYLSLGAYKKVSEIREYASKQMIHQGY